MSDDLADAESAQDYEPDQGQWSENGADLAGAAVLKKKQAHQDRNGYGDDKGGDGRGDDLQTFNGGKNRYGRRDHAVTVKQGRAKQPEDDKMVAAASLVACLAGQNQSGERHDAAFTLVVGAQNEAEVFDGNDQDQSPENQGEDTENVCRGRTQAMGGMKTFFDGVKRTGADIAENDTQSREGQYAQGAALRLTGTGFSGRGL